MNPIKNEVYVSKAGQLGIMKQQRIETSEAYRTETYRNL